MKTLVIAEKPSVAQDIARALGVKKSGEVHENDRYVISAASGHLVELFMPEDIDKKKYGFWRLSELPIIPPKFKLKAIEEKRSKDRLKHLKDLLDREDVDLVLNACDAGREGELIFTYIYEFAKSKKPVRRLWMQSMTQDAIKRAFEDVRGAEEMQGLQDAARSRSEADWLVGINGTRAVTKRLFGRARQVATVGRVQTPTLSIVLQREFAIRDFVARPYWRILGTFHVTEGSYEGTYKKPSVTKADSDDRADRLWDEAAAKAIFETAQRAAFATVADETKRTRQLSGRLYDLTSLQREANGRFGLPANRTLQIAQALYEKHKVLTYPRTDSRALPEDYIPTVTHVLQALEGDLGDKAQPILRNGWVKPNKRIFNNAEVSDHFAIIPTGERSSKLTDDEAKIFDMVARRFLAVFYPAAEFDETTRSSHLAEHCFETTGKILVMPGYLAVYGKAELDRQLPALVPADKAPRWLPASANAPAEAFKARPDALHVDREETKPPPRYTEATLLSAMEGAGQLVEDEDMAAAMKEKGLGTPATRAATIEHLLGEKYLERDGRSLVPTAKAETLFAFLNAVRAEALTRPDLTGAWEHRLLLMERGKLTREEFMGGIRQLTEDIVGRVKAFEEEAGPQQETRIISPTDGKPMVELLRSFKSQDGALSIYKTIGNRRLSEDEVQQLVTDRRVGPLDNFRSKAGKPYSAVLRLDPMNKVVFDFGPGSAGGGDGDGNGEGEPINIAELPVVGVYQPTGATVYATPNGYACERQLKGEKADTFRMSRAMLGKTITEGDVKTLLERGKTDLIKGFRSKKTNRLFDAFLILKPGGGIGFDFPPRAPKKAPARKAAAKKEASS